MTVLNNPNVDSGAVLDAQKSGSRSVVTQITINASPQAVWAVLSDTKAHSDWNPFIRAMSGDLTVGARLAITVEPPNMAPMKIKPTVLAATKDRELRWIGHVGVRGIFDGEHSFLLEEKPGGATRLLHAEIFCGLIARPVFSLIESRVEAGFHAMNAALKERVETRGRA